MRAVVGVVVLVLVLGVVGWETQKAPLTVVCGQVTGGTTTTATGIGWARKIGTAIHDVATNPDEFSDPDRTQAYLDGVFRKTLWFWFRTVFSTSRGEKVDPQILKLEQENAEAVREASASCCPSGPLLEVEPPAADWDSRSATFQEGSGFTNGQLTIAAQADRVRRQLGLPTRATVVILAAGFQESGVANLNYGDRDSLGWLQQRNAWAPRADRMNPTKAARMFYLGGQAGQRGLTDVTGWEQMPITRAVYAVQRSAFPNGAARYEDKARALLAAAGSPDLEESPEAPGYTAGNCTPTGATPDAEGGTVTFAAAPAGFNFAGQKSVDAAIAWMRDQDRRNTGGWQNRCLAAVGQAYGHAGTYTRDGTYYASEQYTMMPAKYRLPTSGNPPRGALVFRDTSNPAGHISISNGDGREWTSDPPGKTGQIGLVSTKVLDSWGRRTGVSAPWFPGKTGVQA